MKSLRLITVALCFSLLSSCSLLTSLLKIPTSILSAAGRTVGLGLTDEAPQPEPLEKSDTIEEAAAERGGE